MAREPENQHLQRLGGEQIAVHAQRIHVAEQRGRETLEKGALAGLVGVDGRDGEVEKRVLRVERERGGLCGVENVREENLHDDGRDVLVQRALINLVVRENQLVDFLDEAGRVFPRRAKQQQVVLLENKQRAEATSTISWMNSVWYSGRIEYEISPFAAKFEQMKCGAVTDSISYRTRHSRGYGRPLDEHGEPQPLSLVVGDELFLDVGDLAGIAGLLALLQLFGSLLQGFVGDAHQRGIVHIQRAETGRGGGGLLGLAQRGADHLQSGVVLDEEVVGRRGALRVREGRESGEIPSRSRAIGRRRWRICGSRTPCRCGRRWRDRRTRRW